MAIDHEVVVSHELYGAHLPCEIFERNAGLFTSERDCLNGDSSQVDGFRARTPPQRVQLGVHGLIIGHIRARLQRQRGLHLYH